VGVNRGWKGKEAGGQLRSETFFPAVSISDPTWRTSAGASTMPIQQPANHQSIRLILQINEFLLYQSILDLITMEDSLKMSSERTRRLLLNATENP
jgi:hypothetical protein